MSSVVYVRYGSAVSNSRDAVSLVARGVYGSDCWVRFISESWADDVAVGCSVLIEERG